MAWFDYKNVYLQVNIILGKNTHALQSLRFFPAPQAPLAANPKCDTDGKRVEFVVIHIFPTKFFINSYSLRRVIPSYESCRYQIVL